MVIPRIFHQIWLGPDPFPDERAAWQETWLRHHPEWELRFWTEGTLPPEPRRREAAELLRAPWERAEALALEAVWRHGGVYVETDVECRRPLEPLLESIELFAALGGSVFGAAAGHRALDHALDELRLPDAYGARLSARRPPRIADLLPHVELEPYAVHHAPRRPDRETLLLELAEVEAKVRRTQAEAYQWRRRYERAQRELTR